MNRLKKLRNLFKAYKLNGYIVPKNDEFFGEYVDQRDDRLHYISSFSGSAGFGLILEKKAYTGFDNDANMVKFGIMNLYLHNLENTRFQMHNSITTNLQMRTLCQMWMLQLLI